ncbi:hypothetical protein DMENIID0001_103680 [Sergentomyia squamirostris]
MKFLVILIGIFQFWVVQAADKDVKTVYLWNNVTYTEPEPAGNFVLGNNIPISMAYYPTDDKLFLTLPRLFLGVPHTLAEIEVKKHREQSPKLSPFSGRPTKPLIMVYQPIIDECNRLWVLDEGEADSTDYNYTKQPPSFVAFDLKQAGYPEIIRHELSKDLLENGKNFFSEFAIDVVNPNHDGCSETFVYVGDYVKNCLYVYDYKQNTSWKFKHDSFKPEGKTTISYGSLYKESYQAGLFGLTLGDRDAKGNRPLFYITASSTKLWKVDTKILKKKNSVFEPIYIGDRGKNTEAIVLAYDPKTKVLFFGESNSRRFSCWNTGTQLSEETVDTVYKNETIFFGTDIEIDSQGTLWLMSNALPPVIGGPLVVSDTPLIRLMKVDPKAAIKSTKCEKRRYSTGLRVKNRK